MRGAPSSRGSPYSFRAWPRGLGSWPRRARDRASHRDRSVDDGERGSSRSSGRHPDRRAQHADFQPSARRPLGASVFLKEGCPRPSTSCCVRRVHPSEGTTTSFSVARGENLRGPCPQYPRSVRDPRCEEAQPPSHLRRSSHARDPREGRAARARRSRGGRRRRDARGARRSDPPCRMDPSPASEISRRSCTSREMALSGPHSREPTMDRPDRNGSAAGPRGRKTLRGGLIGASAKPRGSRVQHLDGRYQEVLPTRLPRANRHDDLPRDRQLMAQRMDIESARPQVPVSSSGISASFKHNGGVKDLNQYRGRTVSSRSRTSLPALDASHPKQGVLRGCPRRRISPPTRSREGARRAGFPKVDLVGRSPSGPYDGTMEDHHVVARSGKVGENRPRYGVAPARDAAGEPRAAARIPHTSRR